MVETGRVAAAPLSDYVGEAWRHVAPAFDPLSGEGARLNGGRFNPPGTYPVLYLCVSRPCALAELRGLSERQAVDLEGLLPRYLYRYQVALDRVLDLSHPAIRDRIGISHEVLTGPWSGCQELGEVAHALGVQAILTPSVPGVDRVLAVFAEHLGIGRLEPELAEEWHRLEDLG